MSSIVAQNLAARLHLLRAIRRTSFREMAVRSGLPYRTLQNYAREKDPVAPNADAIHAMAIGLRVSPNWLILGIDPISLDEVLP